MKPIQTSRIAPLLAALALVACSDSTGPRGDPLMITTETLPTAFLGVPYSAGVNAEGGREGYSWEVVAGRLPNGLDLSVDDLDEDDLLITGVPERLETRTFTLEVTSRDGQTATAQLTIEVEPEPQPLTIQNVILPPTLVDAPYDVPLRNAGGTDGDATPEWSIVEGALPDGLELMNGRIQGTPTSTDTAQVRLRLVMGDETAERSFELRVIRNNPDAFDITIAPVATIPAGIRPHVEAAVERWEEVIRGNLSAGTIPSTLFGSSGCAGFGQNVNGTSVDDLLVLVNIDSIDGPGDVLGQAGPCVVRSDSTGLPAAGILTLDSEDLLPIVGSTTLTYIIAHEIGHVLGFGGLWDAKDLLDDTDPDDPRFTGGRAVQEWQALGRSGAVPVETEGGQGTARSHWRESVFDEELMTGFSERVGDQQPLSRVTIGSLADIGYSVDFNAADPFTLSSGLLADGAAHHGDLGHDVVLREPVLVLPTQGIDRLESTTGGAP